MNANKAYSAVLSVLTALAVLSGSIAVPILCRPFYMLHVSAMHLAYRTGYSVEVIRQAYTEMLNFCVLGTPFGTGELAWSESGRQHFADCAVLFHLDFAVFFAAVIGLLICLFLWKKGMRPHRFAGRGPGFWSGTVLVAVFALTAGLASLNFDAAFTLFHRIFFPGKSNWIFDPDVDEIIRILPEEYFRDCAILIVAVLFACCAVLIAADFRKKRRIGKEDCDDWKKRK